MWIFTPNSFVSAVEDKSDPEMLVIRGRAKGDVIRFLEPVVKNPGKMVEIEASGTDYAVRITTDRKTFLDALLHWGSAIDYTNFKDAVDEQVRHDAYMGVWRVMNRFQNWLNPIIRGRGMNDVKRLGKGKPMSSHAFY